MSVTGRIKCVQQRARRNMLALKTLAKTPLALMQQLPDCPHQSTYNPPGPHSTPASQQSEPEPFKHILGVAKVTRACKSD